PGGPDERLTKPVGVGEVLLVDVLAGTCLTSRRRSLGGPLPLRRLGGRHRNRWRGRSGTLGLGFRLRLFDFPELEGGVLRLTPLQPLVLGGGVLFCFLLFFLPLPYLPDPLLSGFLALTIVLSDFL
ncbi:hypothetical protein, partial [Saccharomonospora viridis]|uniref:hypothetical protein n=1 Tax=Saccharomonospora viridis TaxID=1852 RepID=UPI0024A9643A